MKKVNLANRFLAFAVAMVMFFGISIPVFADEETINEKIANATDEITIALDKDYTEDVVISSGKKVILDLAGHTLRGTDASATPTIKVEKGASLVVKGEGTIINNSTGNGAACIFNNGDVTIENGTIKKETGNKSYYNIANHGKMIINGGTILNDTTYVEGQSHASLVENGYYDYTSTNPVLGYVAEVNDAHPSLEINGGTFDGGLNTIKNDDGATLVINDATVRNQIQVAVFNVSDATINGGKFDVPAGNDKTTVFNRKYDDVIDKGILIVTGGEFNADYFVEVINNATEAQMGEIKISGGTFNTEKGLVNTEGRVDITTIEISGGTFAQEPSGDRMKTGVDKFENASGEWVVGTKVVLTLKFENGSGDKAENHLSGDEVTLPNPTRGGYEFKGWMKDEDTTYNANDKIKVEENLTLTAKWEEEKKESSGETSGDKEVSGEVSGDKEVSGEVSGDKEVSGETSGDKEVSGETSGDKEVSGETSGDKEDNTGSGSHSSSGGNKDDEKTDNKDDEKSGEEEIIFEDVKSGDWYKEYVDKAVEMNLIKGVSDKEFAPNEKLTRGMLIEILYRYSNEKEESVAEFDDVSSDSYYSHAIAWAAKNEIVKGVGNNKFEPDRYITREELATIIYRCAKLADKDIKVDSNAKLEYVDKDEISDFAMDAIIWCTENKIIEGRENKVMAPKDSSTRAEAVTMVVRFVELLKEE